jgi:hypothetical protein
MFFDENEKENRCLRIIPNETATLIKDIAALALRSKSV